MIRYILLIIVSVMLFSSCYRDLGHYDYTTIDSVRIENISKKYPDKIMFEDTLKIFPEVTHREGNFSYKWYRHVGDVSLELISEGKDLIYPVVHAGNNLFKFIVKDDDLGIEEWVHTSCFVTSKTSQGLYVLKETGDGNCDLDMFYSPDKGMENLLESKYGAPMPGVPRMLDYWGYQWEDYDNDTIVRIPSIRVVTDKDLWVINSYDFNRVMQLDQMFLDESMDDVMVNSLQSTKNLTILNYNDGKCCLFNNTTGSRFLPELMGDYSMNSQMVNCYNGTNFYVFDEKTESFRYLSGTASRPGELSRSIVNGIPVVNINKKLIYMGELKMSSGVALMKNKKEIPDSLFIYTLKFTTASASSLVGLTVDTITGNAKLFNAKLFCCHKHHDFLYFVCDEGEGSVVYYYDMKGRREQEVWRSGGEKITHLQYVHEGYFYGGNPIAPEYMKLVVSTYKDGKYKIRYFRTVAGKLEAIEDEVYEGEGKVMKVIKVKDDKEPVWMYYAS